jgi:hypothetical protein
MSSITRTLESATISRILSLPKYDKELDSTENYIASIDRAFDGIYGITELDNKKYSEFIANLPSDLACRLRLVPDSDLIRRMSHLYGIYRKIISGEAINGISKYSIVSVEGSNPYIPFDCDLVIYDEQYSNLWFLDFTTSRSASLKVKKTSVLQSNLNLNKFNRAYCSVVNVELMRLPVNINFVYTSKEPGTWGLKLSDHIMSQEPDMRSAIIENCKAVYRNVNEELANQDNSNPPGDYKDLNIPSHFIDKSAMILPTQSDRDSLRLLRELHDFDPKEFPYYKGLQDLCLNSQKLKKIINIEGAVVSESRDLTTSLAKLADDWLCKALHAATLTENVVGMDENNNVDILKEFPVGKNQETLPVSSVYKVCIQQKKEHVFTIKFNPNYMEENLRRFLMHDVELKDKMWAREWRSKGGKDDMVEDFLSESLDSMRSDVSYFSSPSLEDPRDSIWKKVWTISALSSNDLENFGRSTHSLLESFIGVVSKSYLGSCMAHDYEIMKSILASLKVSPSDSSYYIGVNGAYNSVTITKMSSTLDSFSKTNYCVIFKPERNTQGDNTRMNYANMCSVYRTKFYSIDPNQLSYGIRLPYVYLSFATWELENNMESGAIQNGVVLQTMIDAAFHCSINRDQFAQAAEQIRYFYMSAIGYGGSAAAIVEKTTFMGVKYNWEFLYLLRSFKVGAALTVLSSAKQLRLIEDRKTRELQVAFPHTHYPCKTFNQTVSSMYSCNIFNKFRAFHEVSEAMCYNGIMEEGVIYRNRIDEDFEAVSGLSSALLHWIKIGGQSLNNFLTSTDFITSESSLCERLATTKSKRYCGAAAYMIGATASNAIVSSSVIDSIYNNLNKCPIEACTMRGSMDIGESTKKAQGIRAASAVLEELMRQEGHDPKTVNKSLWGATNLFDSMQASRHSFSIFSNALLQFFNSFITYRYRIVQKDQKGHREISVLNIMFRLGALFVETIFRELSSAVSDVEVVHNPNKDKIVEDAIKESFDEDKKRKGIYAYDNADQKRWGPNHNMNFFSFVTVAMLNDSPGLGRMIMRIFDLTFDKRAKFPESLINLTLDKGVVKSNSVPIQEFINQNLECMNNKIFEKVVAFGMCQGIYHDTSSVVHAIKVKAKNQCLNLIANDVSVRSFTTSDDAHEIYFFPKSMNAIETVKISHSLSLKIGNLFNIVRSNPKSAFNFHIAELNSIFYKAGIMATPSLKQRIAKIDVGMGINPVEDFMSACAAGSNYLSSGGSYMGACIVTVLNFTLHTEQWLRWDFVKSDHYYKPVELGGFPVIEPVSTIISGGISNMFMRVSPIMNAEAYARLCCNTLLCPPEASSLSDFIRSGSEAARKSYSDDDVTIFRGAGPLGMFQKVRTDKKLSQFERKHGISKWEIPDSFISLNRSSPISSNFVFTLYRSTSVHTLDTSLGVNSFFIRFAEPWISHKRKCYKLSNNSPFRHFFKDDGDTVSHEEMKSRFKLLSLTDAGFEMKSAFHRSDRKEEFLVMETQLGVRFNDALSLRNYLASQEAESFRVPHLKPSIQTITLRGHSASDSDSYHLTMIKTLAGKASSAVINEFRRSSTAYDSINTPEPLDPVPLVDAIILADNAISVYDKFIRRDTKMIIPNNVSDLKTLCVDILRNKFTERMGLVAEGSLELDEERSRPYAYSTWYQELLNLSSEYENNAANAILSGGEIPEVAVGINSARVLLTKSDMFSFAPSSVPSKTILIDSRNKDQFINSIKNWISAKVKFVMSRDTVRSFIKGKLTFAHDYYVGDNRFYRYPKDKYLYMECRGKKAMHMIQIVRKPNPSGGNSLMSYRHYFIFEEDVNLAEVTCTKREDSSEGNWLNNLVTYINEKKRFKINTWNELPKAKSYSKGKSSYRNAPQEKDYVCFVNLIPGQEFSVDVQNDSLCFSLVCSNFKLPISYLNPTVVDNINLGHEITDSDFKKATKMYVNLRDNTEGFKKSNILVNKRYREAVDFILTGSTTSTPQWILDKNLRSITSEIPSALQIDIVRTFLVNNTNVGVNYSSGRFVQYLLNLGQRRNHFHSFFSRRIAGERVEYDSEDWDGSSDEEDYVHFGASDPRYSKDVESEEETIIPDYLIEGTDDDTKRRLGYTPGTTSWAEEVIEQATLESTPLVEAMIEDAATREGEDDLFGFDSSTDDDQDDSYNADIVSSVARYSPIETQQAVFSSLLTSEMNNLLSGADFDDVFGIDDDSSEDVNNPARGYSDSINDLFAKAIGSQYGKVIDDKDRGLKSEVTGHTVNPSLENARSMIKFIKGWLSTAGRVKETENKTSSAKNISELTNMYLMLHDIGVLDSVNVLIQFTGSDSITPPVELSALAVINEIYL